MSFTDLTEQFDRAKADYVNAIHDFETKMSRLFDAMDRTERQRKWLADTSRELVPAG